MVINRFGDAEKFKVKVNPDTQNYFGVHKDKAIMGDYPTLTDICIAYGENFSAEWMIPHLISVSIHTGAKNMTKAQLRDLSKIIASEYRHYKITEILLFFYRFKAGIYGKFYGTVDPMVITCALRDFSNERDDMIDHYTMLEEEKRKEQERRDNPPVTMEEWLRMKEKISKTENSGL